MQYKEPHYIPFNRFGEPPIGYLTVAENPDLPFEVKRMFWTYYTPEQVVRGRHAHHETEMILVAVAGRIIVTTEDRDGMIQTFPLEKPNEGLYIPPYSWHTMQYSHNAVQLVLCSTTYDEADYIRDYEAFKNL